MSERKGYDFLSLLAFLAFLSFLAFLIWQIRQQAASTVTVADIQKARELVRRLELER
jgi:protein-S-isoprenylcysteine O-methyltransferase Ste14